MVYRTNSFVFSLLVISIFIPKSHAISSCMDGAYQLPGNETILVHGAEPHRFINTTTGHAGRLFLLDDTSYGLSENLSDKKPGSTIVRFTPQCNKLLMHTRSVGGAVITAEKMPVHISSSNFVSEGVELAGRFVIPSGKGPFPYVVLVHGSGTQSGIETFYHQYGYPSQGIAVFVFDKRGTGKSFGKSTNDFYKMARDAAAALAHVRENAPTEFSAVGFSGFSQGGWVAPLAASMSGETDFVIVNYGMVNPPLYEDKQQALCELKRQNFSTEHLDRASKAIDGAHQILIDGFKEGFESDLYRLRARYEEDPWFGKFQGEFSGEILADEISQSLIDDDLLYNYNSIKTLEQLTIPMFWLIAGSDAEAPPNDTVDYLMDWSQTEANISMQIYDNTDHGLVYFKKEQARRFPTHYAPRLFETKSNWIKGGYRVLSASNKQAAMSSWGWCLD